MGLFNSIFVPCPACREPVEFQTKSGSSSMSSWPLAEAPNVEIEGILGDKMRCERCGHIVSVDKDEPEVKIRVKIT